MTITLRLPPDSKESDGPEDHRHNHKSGGDPGDNEELVALLNVDANLLAEVIDLVDSLGEENSDDDTANEEAYRSQSRHDEVDDDDHLAVDKQDASETTEDRNAAKAHAKHIEDEEAEKSVVDDVELLLDLLIPAQIGRVEIKRTDAELLVKNACEVQTDLGRYMLAHHVSYR